MKAVGWERLGSLVLRCGLWALRAEVAGDTVTGVGNGALGALRGRWLRALVTVTVHFSMQAWSLPPLPHAMGGSQLAY